MSTNNSKQMHSQIMLGSNFLQFLLKKKKKPHSILSKPKKGPYGPVLMVGTLTTLLRSSQLLTTKRVGEGRPITSAAQLCSVIGPRVLVDAVV